MGDVRLVARRLNKSYGPQRVLCDVDIEISAGELVSVVGPSGSGKSTLLYCLGGLVRPDSGAISIGGSDILALRGPGLTRFRRETIGYVFQGHGLLPDLSAKENVALAGWAAGAGRRQAMRRAEMLLAELGLASVIDRLASRLSGGEAQRVSVARAMMNRPSVLLADEPTASLDAAAKSVVAALLASIASEGCAVMLATHDSAVSSVSDRIIGVG